MAEQEEYQEQSIKGDLSNLQQALVNIIQRQKRDWCVWRA